MNIRQLTAKDVRMQIKKGHGLDELCQKCQCTADELQTRLQILFRHDGDKVFLELRDISSKKSRQIARKEGRCNSPIIPPPPLAILRLIPLRLLQKHPLLSPAL